MAKKKSGMQNVSKDVTNSFVKGLNKDSEPSYVTEGMWTHAINATNSTIEGDLGSISNESSNYLCGTAGANMPATAIEKAIIGAIHLYSDKWAVYTAGHDSLGRSVSSEIGLFETDTCTYRIIVQDACLGFDKRYLITGSSREREDCSWQVYWADGLNPDRFLNIGDAKTWPDSSYQYLGNNYYSNGVDTQFLWPGVQWNEDCNIVNDCEFCENTNTLDCDKTRLARLMETPCLNLKLGESGGTVANGTYFAIIAYLIKGQRVTDYFSQSNNQIVYVEGDVSGSLILDVNADQENFDEFECVLVQNVNQGTVAVKLGVYSTSIKNILIDQINVSLATIPLEQLPIQTPVFETSNQITDANGYLLRMAPRSKFDFNYQPLANLIKTKWASVEYPGDYYNKGGSKGNYLRDEVYTFYIRWVYDTGDKSSSYHIPGRPPKEFQYIDENNNIQTTLETDPLLNFNALSENDSAYDVINTAYSTPSPMVGSTTEDGGTVISAGDMGYWQSTEKYPDDKPEIWNPSEYCWTGVEGQSGDFDLCGKEIRHHKFPSDFLNKSESQDVAHFKPNSDPTNTGDDYRIRLLGVFFENIILPKDQDGNDIKGIIGYEILRGTREGNRSILAKGIINNFKTFKFAGSVKQNQTGLYQNYPFNSIKPLGHSNDSSDHNFRFNDPFIKNTNEEGDVINQKVPTDIFTFHSPETQFRNPFLNTSEFKLYGHVSGLSTQQFIEPSDHPKFKLLSNTAIIPAIVAGVAATVVSLMGKKTEQKNVWSTGANPGDAAGLTAAAYATGQVGVTAATIAYNLQLQQYYANGGSIVDSFTSLYAGYGNTILSTAIELPYQALMAGFSATGTNTVPYTRVQVELPNWAYLDPVSRILGAVNHISFYFSEGADILLQSLYEFTPVKQYALQQVSHGFYSNMRPPSFDDLYRFDVEDSFYIKNNIQEVPSYQDNLNNYINYSINNLKRPETVTVRTKSGPYYNPTFSDGVTIGPKLLDEDLSTVTLGTLVQNSNNPAIPSSGTLPSFSDPRNAFGLPIASHYGALRSRIRNQYGQLDSVNQIIITPCEQKLSSYEVLNLSYTCSVDDVTYPFRKINRSNLFFGGDTYITRYTEKNTMLYFYDWLYNQPDTFEFNYYLRDMIPNARFTLNSKRYEIQDLFGNFGDLFNFNNNDELEDIGEGPLPSNFYNLDYRVGDGNRRYDYTDDKRKGFPDKEKGLFSIKEAFFYLANSSVRDFFVETDVLVDFRQQSETPGRKHYNPYRFTDYISMFDINPNVIGQSTDYRYDYSLSISKLYNQYFSQGSLQSKYYNPSVSELCYTYFPDRLIYSLPVQDDSVKDSWFIYLINNYKSFKNEINSIKSINDSGIFITFKNTSPIMYQGVDTLQTDLGTKITIGDGGLFSQPNQNVSAADASYEYGSCQNRLSIISTPVGIYYMSQDQGKIFAYGGSGLTEISNAGMKWWFVLFMPYRLTDDFPDYPYQDNPVCGIGCQAIYDNASTLIYFCKKDYYLKDQFKGRVQYIPRYDDGTGDYFIVDGNKNSKYKLGDEYIFEDASWTVSYDPKSKFFISFHDWHPDINLGTKDYFISTKNNTLWRHNYLCNDYCNYYGKQHGFEVEIPSLTGQNVVTVRSLTYVLECYRRSGLNCVDQHHVLDYNFDQAIVSNSEQVSGYLNLNIYPKNNIVESLKYPKLSDNLSGYDILVSKEEQKYRLNQFWDITKDRAEFPIGSDYPPTGPTIPGTTVLQGSYESQNTWVTSQNGYKRVLNPANLDYNKSKLQRKKFRHYTNFITLTRKECNDINMILKIVNTKNQLSQR